MTREQAIKVLEMVEAHGSIVIEAKKMAVEALKAEPCEDAVSREAVGDIIMWYDGQGEILKQIMDLPSVTPMQRTGHWVGVDQEPHEDWECDRCGHIEYVNEDVPSKYHFCPNCGARMSEPQEREE